MTVAGLPTGRGIHAVNDFGWLSEDIFIPPQRGTFRVVCARYADLHGAIPQAPSARTPAGSASRTATRRT